MTEEMPEKIWAGLTSRDRIRFWMVGKSDDFTEYIQTALAPQWHDKPTCEGDWARYPVHGGTRSIVEIKMVDSEPCFALSISTRVDAEGSRWFGPIPEDIC